MEVNEGSCSGEFGGFGVASTPEKFALLAIRSNESTPPEITLLEYETLDTKFELIMKVTKKQTAPNPDEEKERKNE